MLFGFVFFFFLTDKYTVNNEKFDNQSFSN